MALARIIAAVRQHPEYTMKRSIARFPEVRRAVKRVRNRLQWSRWSKFCAAQREMLKDSMFQGLDPAAFVDALRRDGVAFGLELPSEVVAELRMTADNLICYAGRDYALGFPLTAREKAERILGKPIVTAHYFNIEQHAVVAARIRQDPFLLLVAALYLESLPTHVGTNMWWSFPVEASEEDRDKSAQVYHADIDDFAFIKYFFYLTDVAAGDGADVCVPGSHRSPLVVRVSDRWNVRCYRDEEIEAKFGGDAALEIHGKKGTGFAEDTLCIHPGTAPTRNARLLIQFQYALFDYKVQRDDVDVSVLKRVV